MAGNPATGPIERRDPHGRIVSVVEVPGNTNSLSDCSKGFKMRNGPHRNSAAPEGDTSPSTCEPVKVKKSSTKKRTYTTGARLCKGEVVRIRRHSAAHKAGLPEHELPVFLIAQANRFAQSPDGAAGRPLLGRRRSLLAGVRVRPARGTDALIGSSVRWPVRGSTIGRPARAQIIADCGEPRRKQLLDNSGISRRQSALCGKVPKRADSGLICRIDSCQLIDQALPKGCRLIGRKNGPW